jgi:riboflavin synthase
MFTGIIETTGTVVDLVQDQDNLHLFINSAFTSELKVDQSVAHNGVCLTIVEINGDRYRVTAVAETLRKTNLGMLRKGDIVNLERSLKVGDRLDGHFVQGHVDTIGHCISKQTLEGSWIFVFSFPEDFSALVIEKGSICVNGVSLTAFDVGRDILTVTIIPYTYSHTQFCYIKPGDAVNLEFDVLGKYILRSLSR